MNVIIVMFNRSLNYMLNIKRFKPLQTEKQKVCSLCTSFDSHSELAHWLNNSTGGPVLEASPLATIGFPESLKISDVQYIIDKIPSIEVILKKGPKKSYIAQMGYLEREGFNAALPADSNPLALYAAFDALAKGGGRTITLVLQRLLLISYIHFRRSSHSD